MQKFNIFAKNVSVTRNDDLWVVSDGKVEGGYQVYKGTLSHETSWEDM